MTDEAVSEPGSMVIRPGEGGYVEALAEWEKEQHPDRGEAVSTASGRARSDFPVQRRLDGATLTIKGRTVSGNISLHTADSGTAPTD